jgi:hypothetical protein
VLSGTVGEELSGDVGVDIDRAGVPMEKVVGALRNATTNDDRACFIWCHHVAAALCFIYSSVFE